MLPPPIETKILSFVIPVALPTLNNYVDQQRRHPMAGNYVKQRATGDAKLAATGLLKIEHPAIYVFTWTVNSRRGDPDNVAFAKKFIFDGLMTAGVLENDNLKWVTGLMDFFILGKDPQVLVDVYKSKGVL